MVLTPLLLLFRFRHPLLSTLSFLDRFGLEGYDAFKKSLSERDGAPCAIDTCTTTLPTALPCTTLSVWVISCVYWCAVCNGNKVASLLSYTAASLYSTRTATFDYDARTGCAGSDGGSVLYFTACIVTSTCAFSSNYSDLSSDRCDAQCSS